MPPARMSDILPSSSRTTAPQPSIPTTTPYSSDGPTLPIISASESSKKRKRTAATSNTSPAATNTSTTDKKHAAKAPARTNHATLYTPWELLSARERKAVEDKGTENVEVVVWTRNQNVKAGINRLKSLLGAGAGKNTSGGGDGARSATVGKAAGAVGKEDGEGVIAVSAQGEGTVKLVGIVDVALRVIEENKGRDGMDGTKWFVYTVLSSVLVPRGKREDAVELDGAEAAQDDVEEDAMVVDREGDEAADGEAVKEVSQRTEEMKRVPVLTVWMSRWRMPGWKEVFGEREVVVFADVE
ncbi:hypothetical protein E8E13_009230 [Curvularia kusanoi]|uniref:Uncharacterized protein n=1 Tax=Curvularia kusanoi TaxID=90978 RepID=A0A9P4TK09_CURKU|nr:hypothetical protein E8E13_009230 [Curvularia kusanoi]